MSVPFPILVVSERTKNGCILSYQPVVRAPDILCLETDPDWVEKSRLFRIFLERWPSCFASADDVHPGFGIRLGKVNADHFFAIHMHAQDLV